MRTITLFICSILLSCGRSGPDSSQKIEAAPERQSLEVYRGEPVYMEFEEFFKAFKEAVKTRDKKMLLVLMVDNFLDSSGPSKEEDLVSREKAVEEIDFLLLERLVNMGYSVTLFPQGGGDAYCPPIGKPHNEAYGLSFFKIDKHSEYARYTIPKGWRLTSIYRGD